ncbi:hypothetical protein [Paenibacillus sp. ACRRY]|uniref:hypothetical protein n=1 Tax=Paenibacillus sp. ACRRY TaxID=2918208 RepID=UPI001EF6C5FF|nr:hypothetical protein [Paenibacillus sp. ACRRY]MCG7386859.1 hypothetical protein [Paenibacillus sp. ACRRY]
MNLVELLERSNQERDEIAQKKRDREIQVQRSSELVPDAFRIVFDELKTAGIVSGMSAIQGSKAQIEVHGVPLSLSTAGIYSAIKENPEVNVVDLVRTLILATYRSRLGLSNTNIEE